MIATVVCRLMNSLGFWYLGSNSAERLMLAAFLVANKCSE
jgi:hypothetical protein